MAVTKEYYDQMQAYALGCLEKDDLLKLKNYLHSGEEYAWQELGEYQNLAALLPTILKIESPDSMLKDRVARKLYKIRDEIRAKKTGDPGSAKVIVPEEPVKISSEVEADVKLEKTEVTLEPVYEHYIPDEIRESEKESEETTHYFPGNNMQQSGSQIKLQDFEPVTPARKTSEMFNIAQEAKVKQPSRKPEPEPDNNNHDDFKEETSFPGSIIMNSIPGVVEHSYYNEPEIAKPVKRNFMFLIILSIFVIGLAAAGIYFFMTIQTEVQSFKSEFNQLQQDIKSSAAVNETTPLQEIIQLPGTKIVNLTTSQATGFGRVFLNLEQRKGYLQLGDLPQLPAGRALYLWMITDAGQVIPLGNYKPASEVNYFSLELPEIKLNTGASVVLTEEPETGADRPGNIICLTGKI